MKFHLEMECETGQDVMEVLRGLVREFETYEPEAEDEGRIASCAEAGRKIGEWYFGDGAFCPAFPAAARADGERAGKGET